MEGLENFMKITKSRLKEIIREELAEEKKAFRWPTPHKDSDRLTGKDIIAKMKKSKFKWPDFISKKGMEVISKKKDWSYKELDNLLPDYVPGNEIMMLWEPSASESKINEGLSDLEFVIDQLANSMEHYDEKEFVKHLSKQTKYNAGQLKKVFQAYWKLGAMERHNMFLSGDPKPWLKKLGIR